HLAAAPDTAIAVLIGREVVNERLLRPGLASGIGIGHMRAAPNVESALRIGPAVEDETIEVRVGDVAAELADLHSTRPDLRTDLRAFELAYRVLRKCHPEADLVGTRGH